MVCYWVEETAGIIGWKGHPGLLITDALSVALRQAHGLTELASDHSDFDRVPGITRYAPA
jgi:predicted nucleic acid-binding protein